MSSFRLRNVSLAAVLAGAAAILVAVYVTSYRDKVDSGADLVSVFVAAREIAEDTDGAQVASGDYLKREKVLRRSVVPGAISDPTQIEDKVAAQRILPGEQVAAGHFRPLAQQGIQAKLNGNLRAMVVPGEPHQVLSGKVNAGDHVDVVANLKFKVSPKEQSGRERSRVASRVLLRNVLVLEAPALPDSEGLTGNDDFKATLALTDNQVPKLFYAMKNGDWSLVLRPVAKPADSPESVETVESVLGDGLKMKQIVQLVGGALVGAGEEMVGNA